MENKKEKSSGDIMRKVMEKFVKALTNVFMTVVIIAIFFAMYNFIQLNMMDKKYVNFFGYTFFNVVTGSMEDTININDVIIVKITDNYKEKDIITYMNNKDFITHRIIKMEGDVIITQGDANNTPDNPIDKSVVLGKVVKIIPKLGIWKKVITTPKVLISIVATIILFSFAFSYKKESDKEKEKIKKKLSLPKLKKKKVAVEEKKEKTTKDEHLDTLIEQINTYKEELLQVDSEENLEKTEQLDLLVDKIKECKKDYDKTEQLDTLVEKIKSSKTEEEKTEQLDMLVKQIREYDGGKTEILDTTTWGRGKNV